LLAELLDNGAALCVGGDALLCASPGVKDGGVVTTAELTADGW